eukprot:2071353-Pyramimonas_sp.AAC.1
MRTFVENYHKWHANTNKAIGTAFEETLERFVGSMKFMRSAISKLHDDGTLTQSIDPSIDLLTVAVKQFPEQSTLHTTLEALKQLKLEKSTSHFSARVETDCKALQAAISVDRDQYDITLARKLQATVHELAGVKLITEAKKCLFKSRVQFAGWTLETWYNDKHPIDMTVATDLLLKSSDLINIGTQDPAAPAQEIRAVGLLFKDLHMNKETQELLIAQGLMQGDDKEKALVDKDRHAGYHSIAKFMSLTKSSDQMLGALSKNPNFKDEFRAI